VRDDEGRETALIYPREREAPQPVKSLTGQAAAASLPQAFAAVPAPRPVPVVSPSSARGHVAPVLALDSLAEQVRDAETARQEGIALHALLQHLGRVERELWPSIVPRALAALWPQAGESHERVGAKAMSILTRPELAPIFAPNSRAEVPFLVAAQREGTPIQLGGRIDRLVIDDSRILVVDYKSDMTVPLGPGDVPGPYLTQLALYALVASQLFPTRKVEAAILWTGLESLMILPSDLLVEAAKGFTLR
jgi:ATP-dependent helicase/nuclease subunit A